MKSYERGVVHVRVTCVHITYVFYSLDTFSIMQLGPEKGTGVGIAKATEQQDCGTCTKLFGECVLNTINL